MKPVERWHRLAWIIAMIVMPTLFLAAGVSLSTLVAVPVAVVSPACVAVWRMLR